METYKPLTSTQTDDIMFVKLNRPEKRNALNDTLILELERISLKLKAASTGSSNHIERLIIATKAPSLDLGEITDKGYLHQRAILNFRADLVAALYDNKVTEHMITGG